MQVFSYEYCEISKDTFFTEYLQTTASGKWKYIPRAGGWVEFYYVFIYLSLILFGIYKRLVNLLTKNYWNLHYCIS